MSTTRQDATTGQPRWLDDGEQRAWRGYMRMRTLLNAQIVRDLAREAGLSGPDYDVLSNLSEAEGRRARLGELAAHMAWSRSRLSHQITRMEQRGLVTRQGCADDGRGAFVVLTDAGFAAIEAAGPGPCRVGAPALHRPAVQPAARRTG